ncbi:MAG TPA: DUF6502 family protein [Variovorax sp.]|nr:DUF6502 family protein [Variovorax sp.]
MVRRQGTSVQREDISPAAAGGQEDLLGACQSLLAPLAQLTVAHGLPFARLQEVLKTAVIDAARAAHPGVAAHRSVSRISAATGLNRREVSRLVQPKPLGAPPRGSLATQVFTRWLSDPAFKAVQGRASGRPMALPRQGPAPSFEALAQSVTRDVHPRSLLEELCRLALVRWDEGDDRVYLLRESFVPQGDMARMLGFLGANVGDHLSAAVANVLSGGTRHFEQALFADELSSESLARARELVTAQWQVLLSALAPALRALIEDDRSAGRPQDQRLRIGLYAYTDAMPNAGHPAAAASPVAKPKEH